MHTSNTKMNTFSQLCYDISQGVPWSDNFQPSASIILSTVNTVYHSCNIPPNVVWWWALNFSQGTAVETRVDKLYTQCSMADWLPIFLQHWPLYPNQLQSELSVPSAVPKLVHQESFQLVCLVWLQVLSLQYLQSYKQYFQWQLDD